MHNIIKNILLWLGIVSSDASDETLMGLKKSCLLVLLLLCKQISLTMDGKYFQKEKKEKILIHKHTERKYPTLYKA